jgi:hypothetical protein
VLVNAVAGRHAGSGFAEFLRVAILPNLALASVTYAVGRLALPWMPDRGYPTLFLSFGLVSLFHAGLSALFLVDRVHLRAISAYAAGRLAFARAD